MSLKLPQGMTLSGKIQPGFDAILTPEALAFVADLHRTFEARRQALLAARVERTARLDAGERPDFLESTRAIREGDWKVAPLPAAEILFVSSNCWDAIGAAWHGYTTLWVNRANAPMEQLGIAPTRVGGSLRDVLEFF